MTVAPNVLLSQEDEMLPATMTTPGEERDVTVRGTLGGQEEECRVLSMRLELDFRRICEEIT